MVLTVTHSSEFWNRLVLASLADWDRANKRKRLLEIRLAISTQRRPTATPTGSMAHIRCSCRARFKNRQMYYLCVVFMFAYSNCVDSSFLLFRKAVLWNGFSAIANTSSIGVDFLAWQFVLSKIICLFFCYYVKSNWLKWNKYNKQK